MSEAERSDMARGWQAAITAYPIIFGVVIAVEELRVAAQ
jgi:hypothetical protein